MQTENGGRPPSVYRVVAVALIILGTAILISAAARDGPPLWIWR